MDLEFNKRNTKAVIKYNNKILKGIASYIEEGNRLKEISKAALNRLFSYELYRALDELPIDTINKNRVGIKLKALKDYNILTMANIYRYSYGDLCNIPGIGSANANKIIEERAKVIEPIEKGIHISLSIDDKNDYSNDLILALYEELNKEHYIEKLNSFMLANEDYLRANIKACRTKASLIRWMLSGKGKRQAAEEGFKELSKFANEGKLDGVREAIKAIRGFNNPKLDSAWEDFKNDPIKYNNLIDWLNPSLLDKEAFTYGLPDELAKEIEEECFFPDGLLCTLRPYQEWGVKYILHQENVLLGDEMGLGKTIEAIATMVSLKNTGATHFIVICPYSVVVNWFREIKKNSKLHAIMATSTHIRSAFEAWVGSGGVLVTNFEATAKIDLDGFKYSLIVVDEAHYIKNKTARRTISTLRLAEKAERKLFMTGTALENKVDEMISLIDDLNPKIASTLRNSGAIYAPEKFKADIVPVYYRRKREDVLKELPEKSEMNEWCTLNPREEQLYEDAVLDKQFMLMRRVSFMEDDLTKSSKAERILEIVNEAIDGGRKVLIFSFFLSTIEKLMNLLGDIAIGPINGSINVNKRQDMIDEFSKSETKNVLLAEIVAGSTDLNIQSASVVIFCEPQLKPSLEDQALSRAYRMGQSRKVLVYRILCPDTIDERLIEILDKKREIFKDYADESLAARDSIEPEVLGKDRVDIINSEIDRINRKREAKGNNSSKDNIDPSSVVKDVEKPRGNKYSEAELIEQHSPSEYSYDYSYYSSLMRLSYQELVDKLLKRYGNSKYDYFLTSSFASKNTKVSRAMEGLECHHIDENKAILLSNPQNASMNPFEYQLAKRLVYCNMLEHLLLHIKIAEEDKSDSYMLLGIGGAIIIAKRINDYFGGYQLKSEAAIAKINIIKNDYASYIMILKYFSNVIANDYRYKERYSKRDLARMYDNTVVEKIYNDIK